MAHARFKIKFYNISMYTTTTFLCGSSTINNISRGKSSVLDCRSYHVAELGNLHRSDYVMTKITIKLTTGKKDLSTITERFLDECISNHMENSQ